MMLLNKQLRSVWTFLEPLIGGLPPPAPKLIFLGNITSESDCKRTLDCFCKCDKYQFFLKGEVL